MSRVKGPVWGVDREMRVELKMVEEGKSKYKVREMWVVRGCVELVKE